MPRYKPIFERFSEKYRVNEETCCWDWMGTKVGLGYGMIRGERGAASMVASRFSYEHFKGPIPDGMIVRHRCDNPGCVNPDHLVLGTHQDNMNDMVERGRGRGKTEAAYMVLSNDQRDMVKGLIEAGFSIMKVAKQFGVSRRTVRNIVDGNMSMEDAAERRRVVRLADHEEIFRLWRSGMPQAVIGARYGVDQTTISRIVIAAREKELGAMRQEKSNN